MTVARLLNLTTGNVIAGNVFRARSVWSRLCGLLSRASVAPDEGLWFDNCSAIHTIGMRSTIDAIFLDGAQRVIGLRQRVRPHSLLVRHPGARTVIELGTTDRPRGVNLGDRVGLA